MIGPPYFKVFCMPLPMLLRILCKGVELGSVLSSDRDVLFIDDLINACDLALQNIDTTRGKVYNIGGGQDFTLSLVELIKILEDALNKKIPLEFCDLRPGDQPVYISNTQKAAQEFGWKPQVSPREGVSRLIGWIQDNPSQFE